MKWFLKYVCGVVLFTAGLRADGPDLQTGGEAGMVAPPPPPPSVAERRSSEFHPSSQPKARSLVFHPGKEKLKVCALMTDTAPPLTLGDVELVPELKEVVKSYGLTDENTEVCRARHRLTEPVVHYIPHLWMPGSDPIGTFTFEVGVWGSVNLAPESNSIGFGKVLPRKLSIRFSGEKLAIEGDVAKLRVVDPSKPAEGWFVILCKERAFLKGKKKACIIHTLFEWAQ
jgi:hypothetical protein